LRGVNIFELGSGNIGATNVGRVLGWGWFFPVFFLDLLKGAGPVLLAKLLVGRPELLGEAAAESMVRGLPALAGLAAILGHMWPIYLGFRGGKGVATAAGVIAVLSPIPALCALVTWIIVALLARYVSAASIAAAVALCVARFVDVWPAPFSEENAFVTGLCMIGAALVIIRHRSNLVRLWNGTEPKIGKQPHPHGLAEDERGSQDSP
jgi:glycerol-3-phosphate acyltransferase PlsY